MRPEWKDAPEWANFLAQDRTVKWHWFEKPPMRDRSDHVWYSDEGRYIEASRKHNPQWEKSLECRPLEKVQRNRR